MQAHHKGGVNRPTSGKGSRVYVCFFKLTADVYKVPAGTTFVCANQGLISLGRMLARFNRKQDDLKFVLAPPDQQVQPTQRGR